MVNPDNEKLRNQILGLVSEFGQKFQINEKFVEGTTIIPPSGKCIGGEELAIMVDAVLDGWLTTGRFNKLFQKKLSDYLGVKHVLTTNSGSSANLLAVSALTSPKLGDRRLKKGDEIITVAAGFPTTINPIIQNGFTPVFVDVELGTYNIKADSIENAITDKTKAIVLAHTLGNPFNVKKILEISSKYNLWLIEDCCDALGSTYTLKNNKKKDVTKMVGSFGDIGTLSFYPAHHITMGEGGAVFTNSPLLKPIIESFRDWGRDCYCQPGKDNTCGKRFNWKLGDLPAGYDHKYIYSHAGYNLKITDMQAAGGLAQFERLSQFVEDRKSNFKYLKEQLIQFEDYLILPKATENADPSWFGFPITVRNDIDINRLDLVRYLDKHKIGTRQIFAGNIIKQPYFKEVSYRVSGDLNNSDIVMNNSFWLGVYPGITTEMLDYIVRIIKSYFETTKRKRY